MSEHYGILASADRLDVSLGQKCSLLAPVISASVEEGRASELNISTVPGILTISVCACAPQLQGGKQNSADFG